MKILVINAGSSSLKYQLIDMSDESVIAKGLCERIGIDGSVLTHKAHGKEFVFKENMPSHVKAIQMVLDALTGKDCGVVSSMKEIAAVGHRVVHGAEDYKSSVLIDEKSARLLQGKHRACAAAQSREYYGNRGVQKGYARYAHGSGIRHGFSRHNARRRFSLRLAL